MSEATSRAPYPKVEPKPDFPAIERRIFFTKPVAASPGYEAHMGAVAIPPGGVIAWHTHFGDEIGYVAEGEIEFELDGEAMQKLKAGDSFFAPAGKRHTARNSGTTVARAVATWVVEKGKSLATPAPK